MTGTLTCPQCEHKQEETIPENACKAFYICDGCDERIRPEDGDCCVFCSYADEDCPMTSL